MACQSVLTAATWPEREFPVINPTQLDVQFPIQHNVSSEWPGKTKQAVQISLTFEFVTLSKKTTSTTETVLD
jgi:hypothetical protein